MTGRKVISTYVYEFQVKLTLNILLPIAHLFLFYDTCYAFTRLVDYINSVLENYSILAPIYSSNFLQGFRFLRCSVRGGCAATANDILYISMFYNLIQWL